MKRLCSILLLAALIFGLTGISAEAAANTASKPYQLIETSYTVQQSDTLRSIAETYMKKNTYGPREIREFESGIKELNPWLLKKDVKKGDVIRINYWIKA